ncbi:MAG: hypothetical protein DYG89_17165 [Caldilinea sp. CFX5]|nr:hypothetical protein [Caldilinea sp. CFX5]
MNNATTVTKSVRFDQQESALLAQISQAEGISEAALMKRLILAGIADYQIERAITAYQRGEADLSAAARYAGISVYQMMAELEKRDITPPAAAQKFTQGLKTLVETFGGSPVLQQLVSDSKA